MSASQLNPLILAALHGRPEALDAYALAKLLSQTPMAVGRALGALEAKGLVESEEPAGTANDLARQFRLARARAADSATA